MPSTDPRPCWQRQLGVSTGLRIESQLFDIFDHQWCEIPWPLHAVATSLAVHHLDGPGRAQLFSDMAAVFTSGGALVICDLVESTSPQGNEVYARHCDDGMRERALSLDGNLDKLEFFRDDGWNHYGNPEPNLVEQPSPLLALLKWMEAASLPAVDVHWLKAGHAIFSGGKS